MIDFWKLFYSLRFLNIKCLNVVVFILFFIFLVSRSPNSNWVYSFPTNSREKKLDPKTLMEINRLFPILEEIERKMDNSYWQTISQKVRMKFGKARTLSFSHPIKFLCILSSSHPRKFPCIHNSIFFVEFFILNFYDIAPIIVKRNLCDN